MRTISLCLLFIVSVLTVTAQEHPLPLTSENYEQVLNNKFEFSQIELLNHVQFLASDSLKGRRTGEPGNLIARNYIIEQLQNHGLSLSKQRFSFMRNGKEYEGVNIIATVTGTRNPENFIAVTAHYDHLGIGKPVNNDSIYNGADDNASGVAALIEMAKYFKKNPPKNSILFLALDAEEMGLQGARYFVDSKMNTNIVLNINMDMISRNDDDEIYITGTRFTPSLKNYFLNVPSYLPIKVRLGHDGLDGKDSWVTQSDHFPFFDKNIPFLYFGVEDHHGYHKPSDEFENIHPDFYFEVMKFIANSLADLDNKIK